MHLPRSAGGSLRSYTKQQHDGPFRSIPGAFGRDCCLYGRREQRWAQHRAVCYFCGHLKRQGGLSGVAYSPASVMLRVLPADCCACASPLVDPVLSAQADVLVLVCRQRIRRALTCPLQVPAPACAVTLVFCACASATCTAVLS